MKYDADPGNPADLTTAKVTSVMRAPVGSPDNDANKMAEARLNLQGALRIGVRAARRVELVALHIDVPGAGRRCRKGFGSS